MNNYDSSIKSMYLTIFILGLVELLLTFVGIATFIIALILQSKLTEAGKPTSPGIKLMLIGSGECTLAYLFSHWLLWFQVYFLWLHFLVSFLQY